MFEYLKIKKGTPVKSVTEKKTEKKNQRTVQDDLTDTKKILASLKEIQKSVTLLKRQGKNNPKLEKLLESISNEAYKICLKC